MTNTLHLTLTLFGAFRQYTQGSSLSLDVPVGTTIVTLRPLLEQALRQRYPQFSNAGLINDSAVADANSILPEDTALTDGMTLAILPPVCGG